MSTRPTQPPKVKIRPASSSSRFQQAPEAALQQLQKAITAIYHQQQSQLKFEECYRNAYNLVRGNMANKLHGMVISTMGNNLDELGRDYLKCFYQHNTSDGKVRRTEQSGSPSGFCDEVVPTGTSREETQLYENSQLEEPITNEEAEVGVRFLKALSNIWDRHLLSLPKIASILCYMDKHFLDHPTDNCRPLMQDGPSQFHSRILLSNGSWVKTRMIKSVLGQIEYERRGELGNRSVVRSIASMLLLLEEGAYEGMLETPYLTASVRFFEEEIVKLMETGTSVEVLKKIDQRLTEEIERCTNCLCQATLNKAVDSFNKNIVVRFAKAITDKPESGLVHLLNTNNIIEINLMYRIFKGADSLDTIEPMRETLKNYYNDNGRAIAPPSITPKGGRSAPAISWVRSVIELKHRWDKVYAEGLNSDRVFQAAVTEGFTSFINGFPHAAEFLSLFIDDHFKAVGAGKADNSEEVQGTVISLFRFLHDKDMFEGFYRTHLAKRILMGPRVDLLAEDAERAMLQKLRLECGVQFTAKLEGMFKDLVTASDISQAFRDSQGIAANKIPFELSVMVLTSSVWPIRTPPPCILPSAALRATNIYSDFYALRHSGRKLTWINNLGTCEIRASFGDRRYELTTNTYQMVILLLFNKNDTLSYGEIKAQTGLMDYELRRHLFSLSAARHMLLTKSSAGKEITANDIFQFNEKFHSSNFKVKLPTPLTRLDAEVAPQSDKPDDDAQTRADVELARGHLIEAAIVRVMKTRRRLPHARLVAEVSTHLQSRFHPDPSLIKKKVEALIDREFLERIDGDMNMYHYLA